MEHFLLIMPIILPVDLYGCGNSSLPLRMEHKLRVSENRVLSRIFGPKRGEVTGDWIKLHNGSGRTCITNGETRNARRILLENPKKLRPLGRPRRGSWIILSWFSER
jgi:hypothetical protein